MNTKGKRKPAELALSAAGSLRTRVYGSIRRELKLGRLAPGAMLTEQVLAERLGVSRTPVREVLATLAQEGLLHRAGRSFVVPTFTHSDLAEIKELRLLLELPAMRRICNELDDDSLKRLAGHVAAQREAHQANDWEKFTVGNERFHKSLRELIASERMKRAIALYSDQVQALRVQLREPKWREYVLAGLDRFIGALEVRDQNMVESAWRDHIDGAHLAGREWLDANNAG